MSSIEAVIHHPAELKEIVSEARVSLARIGTLPNTEIWNYLTWRHDLDPARFDRFHPEFVGIFLREKEALENSSASSTIAPIYPTEIETIPAASDTGSTGTGGTSSGPGPLGPDYQPGNGSVPEPSSVVLLAVAMMVGFMGILKRRGRSGRMTATGL